MCRFRPRYDIGIGILTGWMTKIVERKKKMSVTIENRSIFDIAEIFGFGDKSEERGATIEAKETADGG